MSDFIKSLFHATEKAHEEGRPKVPSPDSLYHFTDINALKAMITTKTIRVSLSTALNDASEGIYGIGLAHKILLERSRPAQSFEEALVNLIEEPSRMAPSLSYDMFPVVACFCAGDDTSSQWMHYGRGGRGVAIGFNPKVLEKVPGMAVRKVDYELSSQRSRIETIMSAGKSVWEADSEARQAQKGVVFAAHVTLIGLSVLAAELKHPSFRNENEWRLLGHDLYLDGKLAIGEGATRGPTEYRITDDGRLVPFEDLPFPTLEGEEAIKSVVLGYSSSCDISAVKRLLLHQKSRAMVSRSDVPVR